MKSLVAVSKETYLTTLFSGDVILRKPETVLRPRQ